MDLNEFRSFINDSGYDIWTWIDMAISVACDDHEDELKNRRDGIIQKLYAPAFTRCHNCNFKEVEGSEEECQVKQDAGFDCHTSEQLQSRNEEDEDDGDNDADHDDEYDEKKQILEIKIMLDDQNQSERCLIDLLQRLVGMDTTFKTLKETDIGRHVSKLRKHSSNEVRRLVKILVRKWKDTVDEWVRLCTPMDEATQLINGDKNSPSEAHHDHPVATTPSKEKVKLNQIELDKLGSAKKRLHDQDFQEAQHGKKQKTSEVMEFHNIPKLKNAVVTNNRGSVPVKYW